jgi:hypothetical protein
MFFALGTLQSSAAAVDWYPPECTRASHCAEADEVTYARADGRKDTAILAVTTRHGIALVPRRLPPRTSMNEAIHACMRVEQEGKQLTCLFLPPGHSGID